MKKWTQDRTNELELFRQLLIEAQSINRGSHVLERLRKVIDLAETLDHVDIGKGRDSFYNFLRDLCIEDRFPPDAAPQGGSDG